MSIPSAVQELIDGSGNNFHAKVARWLASDGWRIAISPYYMDQGQQKARELDLIAEKQRPVKNYIGQWTGEVVVRLFVECKYVPGHSVFWFVEKSRKTVEQMVCSSGTFRPNNTYTSKHHYLSGSTRVAKLFASSNARGQESEPFYKALNQALNGLVAMRTQTPQLTLERQGRGSTVVLNFPVVICSSFSQLYAADFGGAHETTQIADNFQLEVQYAFADAAGQSREDLFLLDFVEYDKLPQFIASITEDANVAAFFAAEN
jgi:hypothetical protein